MLEYTDHAATIKITTRFDIIGCYLLADNIERATDLIIKGEFLLDFVYFIVFIYKHLNDIESHSLII